MRKSSKFWKKNYFLINFYFTLLQKSPLGKEFSQKDINNSTNIYNIEFSSHKDMNFRIVWFHNDVFPIIIVYLTKKITIHMNVNDNNNKIGKA